MSKRKHYPRKKPFLKKCRVTHKNQYRSEVDAKIALSRVQGFVKVAYEADERPKPTRVYRCEHCAHWHMTKKELRKKAQA